MEALIPVVCFLVGIIIGYVLCNLAHKRAEAAHREQIQNLRETRDAKIEAMREQQQTQIATLKETQTLQIEALHAAQKEYIDTLRKEFEKEREQLKERIRQREEDMRRENLAQFKAVAAEIFKEHTGGLKQANAEQLDALLRPLSENIEGFRKIVRETYVQETASRKSLTDQIERLMKLNETIGLDARNLTSALKGNSKVQGDWGEMVLETMLQRAGLEQGIHYQCQVSRDTDGTPLRAEGGELRRPDVIVFLPDSRKLIIDSKVSLTAFADYCNASDEAQRRRASQRNLESVRRHIDELASKRYQDVVEGSARHTLMFIPNEGAYIAAIQESSELWQYAWERNVAIVSPIHLFSVMKVISQLWIQDKQNRNTLEIARRGGRLYEKIAGYVSALQEVGTHLQRATVSYDTALSRLTSGRGNIVKLAQELKELGAKTEKQLPPTLTDKAQEETP